MRDRRAHLSRRNVPRELLEPATPAGLVRMALAEWGMMAGLWAAIAVAPWWLYPPLALALAGRFHALGVVLHDAAHMPLRRKTAGIRVVEVAVRLPDRLDAERDALPPPEASPRQRHAD